MRIHDWFEYHARSRPDIPFLEMDGTVMTYAQADRRADLWARALTGAGLKVGDRIAYLSTNDIDMGVMLMACSKAGVAPVMLNYRLAPREMAFILRDADPRLIFARGAPHLAMIESILPDLPGIEARIAVGTDQAPGWTPLDAWLDAAPAAAAKAPVRSDDMLYLLYTSGTTGLPKGIMISHTNVVAHVEQSMCASIAGRAPGARALLTTPIYHAAGVLRIMTAAINGGTVVLMEHFEAKAFLHNLATLRINTVNMVPAIIQQLLDMPEIRDLKFPDLQVIYYGAAPIADPVLRRALATFDCPLIQGYGLSESTGGIAYLNEVDHQKALAGRPELLKSTGRAVVLAEISIRDNQGHPVPPGTVGELCVRGPNVMKGYWRNPEGTAQAIRDGWLHSGDAASLDAEGYVYLHDRIKDMIVSGGTNLYPMEIESALAEHPDIRDVAVIGIPHDKWGEAPLAVCVTRSGQPLDAEILIAFCRDRLGGYKIPRQYTFVAELPRNASGKVLKRVLREPWWAGRDRSIA